MAEQVESVEMLLKCRKVPSGPLMRAEPLRDRVGAEQIECEPSGDLHQRMEALERNADCEDLMDAPFLHWKVTKADALTRMQANPICGSSRSTGCPAAHSCARRLFVWKGATKRRDGRGSRGIFPHKIPRLWSLRRVTNGSNRRGQHPHQQARRSCAHLYPWNRPDHGQADHPETRHFAREARPGPDRPGSAAHPRGNRQGL